MRIVCTYLYSIVGLFLIVACNNGPRVIEPSTPSQPSQSNIFEIDPKVQVIEKQGTPFGGELHKVTVKKVLQAMRYVYLEVEENEHTFWIATRKKEVAVGESYFYQGGLLKTNFESKEHSRMFDTIYLISNLVSTDHSKHSTSSTPIPKTIEPSSEEIPTHTEKTFDHKGLLSISELVQNPAKYEGHTVQIKGKCVKVNPNIMDRNWIHIQDGTQDNFDLVVTSATFVPEGKTVTIKAVVSRNRDFGAGYRYDLILENGMIIQ